MTEQTSEPPPFSNELVEYFNDLKKLSLSHKLGQIHEPVGDEIQNPLHQQFALILAKIEEQTDKHPKESDQYTRILSMKASIIYEKAKILLTEHQLAESKALLEEALDSIKELSEHPKVAFLHMRIVNHLTYVLSRLGELEKAKELLIKAIEEEGNCKPEVFSTEDLFLNIKKDAKISLTKLNRLTINNMQMLAWIYAKLGHTEENFKVQHDILQKQLDLAEADVFRWAESCFRLAGMFVGKNDWENARYHLAAAETVLNPLEACLVPNPEVYTMQADLARSWVYYGLQLFEASRKAKCLCYLLNREDTEKDVPEKPEDSPNKPTQPLLTFRGLQVEIPPVPILNIESIQQAKILFAIMQKWIKRARLYYTLRDYPLQYVNLSLDLSELYRFVAFYEEDIDSEYTIQKKRYDALEALSSILKEVRPNCYIAVNLELTKEITEVQMELMNINLKKISTPSPEPRVDIPESTFKRQISALSSLQHKLVNVTSAFNTSVNNPEKKPVEQVEEKPAEVKEKVKEIKNEGDSNTKEEVKEE